AGQLQRAILALGGVVGSPAGQGGPAAQLAQTLGTVQQLLATTGVPQLVQLPVVHGDQATWRHGHGGLVVVRGVVLSNRIKGSHAPGGPFAVQGAHAVRRSRAAPRGLGDLPPRQRAAGEAAADGAEALQRGCPVALPQRSLRLQLLAVAVRLAALGGNAGSPCDVLQLVG
ncbi:unnamed protein product, partial [Prorocentrum cordatum]